jgi:transglutaminase-like putative cysteine protease
MSKRHQFFCISLLLIQILIWNGPRDSWSAPAANSNIVQRHVEYGFTLCNATNVSVKRAELWACIPIQETSLQRRLNVYASYPYELVSDNNGNQMLHFVFNDFAPFDAKVINIGIDLQFSEEAVKRRMDSVDTYINPEPNCESQDKDIIQLAAKLKSKDIVKTAENINRWVFENLKYTGYSKDVRGAHLALETREGDCTEYMFLFMALCRADRIPTRGMGGFLCNRNSVLRPEDYHNWAEFYADNAWHIADPQNKSFMKNEEQYVAMRYTGASDISQIGDENLFGFKGDGITAKMN